MPTKNLQCMFKFRYMPQAEEPQHGICHMKGPCQLETAAIIIKDVTQYSHLILKENMCLINVVSL